MSGSDHEDFDPQDLVARARRGVLSRAERDALALALEASPELATAYRVGVEIDRASAVQGGDDALIGRAADAAMARVERMTGRTPQVASGAARSSRWAAAAAVLLSVIFASGIAAALFTGAVWPLRSAPEPQVPSAAPAPMPKKHKRAPVAAAAPAPVDVQALPPEELAAPEVVANEAAPRPARKAGADESNAGEAAELFHDANDARRNGELRRAQRLYVRLIEQHPSSDEAGLARVSLGRLLLSAGDARAAEREFRRYLSGGGGQLAEEALVGQAESLGRLKRPVQERQAWQRLLAAHPGSVYAAQAKQRLAALSANDEDGAR